MPRNRDGSRTREAVLNAAEGLFAEKGYEGTSLEEIGSAAGVSRGTPSYFFGSKEKLYRAVLDRLFARAYAVLAPAHAAAGRDAKDPRAAIESLIGAYLDFLAEDVNFVRLVHRETAEGRTWLRETLEDAEVIQAALGALPAALGGAGGDPAAAHLLINVSALVWYPLAQAHTLLAALGIDPRDAAFLETQKRQITEVLLAAAGAEARPSGPPR